MVGELVTGAKVVGLEVGDPVVGALVIGAAVVGLRVGLLLGVLVGTLVAGGPSTSSKLRLTSGKVPPVCPGPK